MPDPLFESLENRSLLSQVTLLTGMPADPVHERQAIEALAGDDNDIYRFIGVEDDAIYEEIDGDDWGWGDEVETYGHLAADVAVLGMVPDFADVDSAEVGTQEWVNRSAPIGDVDSSALARAVQAAHGTPVLPIEPGDQHPDDKPGEGKRPSKVSLLAQIRFDFSR